jgi:hypothetical protein
MDHRAHQPGTVADCPDCQGLAVEPGWYKAMRDERVTGTAPTSVVIPDASGQEVEPAAEELPATNVVVPELEQTHPDELT